VITNNNNNHNKPDITVRDNGSGIYLLTDIAISGDLNLIKKKVDIYQNRNTLE
jgi:hypothetical protein